MNFACNINCSLMFVICQNTLQNISGMFFFFRTNLFSGCTTDSAFSFQLVPFSSRLFRRDEALTSIPNDCSADSLLLIGLSSLTNGEPCINCFTDTKRRPEGVRYNES